MAPIEVFAPAKVNLTLHVTGRRADGYHLLDSLVAFAPVGDVLRLDPAEEMSLHVTGRESTGVPGDSRNLAWAAAELVGGAAAMVLEKHLPAASGIGGGSADAAAAIRGMRALRGLPEALPPEDMERALALGADLPMCLACQPLRASGIGEVLSPVALPATPAVLVNPRLPVSTPEVFRALASRDNPPMPETLPAFGTPAELIAFLTAMRNDLEPPAMAVQPAIGEVLATLGAQRGCRLARMSGSGATCFGLFESAEAAGAASVALSIARPGWWVRAGALGDASALARPKAQ